MGVGRLSPLAALVPSVVLGHHRQPGVKFSLINRTIFVGVEHGKDHCRTRAAALLQLVSLQQTVGIGILLGNHPLGPGLQHFGPTRLDLGHNFSGGQAAVGVGVGAGKPGHLGGGQFCGTDLAIGIGIKGGETGHQPTQQPARTTIGGTTIGATTIGATTIGATTIGATTIGSTVWTTVVPPVGTMLSPVTAPKHAAKEPVIPVGQSGGPGDRGGNHCR